MVGQNNVRNSIDSILSKSPMLKEMSVTGKIKIVGAYYDIQSGKVNFL
jgi:carbonic anhydrase